MFCIKCGKDAKVGNFCERCFLESNELFDIDNSELYFCRGCSGYFLKNEKVNIDDVVKKGIKSENRIKKIQIKKKKIGNKIYVTVICSGYIKPCKKLKEEAKKILINIKKRMCDTCIKLSGGYYEAMIQVRGDNREKIFNIIKKLSSKALISSIEKAKLGYDIKFVSKKDATKIANQMRKKFSVKDTYKLVGEKKGKKLYRNFYVIR